MEATFEGRVLFLSPDADVMRRQLAGEDLALDDALPLRDNVSTDEITPAWICYYFDEKLGDYPYLGLNCNGETPVAAGSVKRGGFSVAVAGQRYGKGSSREASPYAERLAGIRLVIARSFERIYRQNCHNLGLLTSTDFGLIERIRNGEAIAIEEFTRGEDPVTADIIRRGGLFAFTRARLAGKGATVPPAEARPMTYAEKILTRACAGRRGSVRPGDALFARADWRYAHEYVAPMAIRLLELEWGQDVTLRDPKSIVCFADHLNFIHRSMPAERRAIGLLDAAQAMAACQQAFCQKHKLTLHGNLRGRDGAEGISHSIMAERYVEPGQLVVGTDSHTPHCGALGALAFGVGASEMASAWLTGEVRVTVPPTCRVRLDGELPAGVEAKDVVLHLLRLPYVREGRAIGQVIEYSGQAILGMNTDERATLTNMAAEIGGFCGIVAPDAETITFLRERRGLAMVLDLWMRSDPDAEFAHTIEVDCGALEPMLAQPGDPGNGIEVSRLPAPVAIDIAYGGSCTGGKREDLRRYHQVLQWALQRGLAIAPRTRFYLQFGSQDVREHCQAEQMMDVFHRAGVELVEPGCGACINAGPGVSQRPEQVTVSAVNRNFPGRSGPGQVWLASPSTVAASAIAGRLVSFAQLQRMHTADAVPARS